MNYFDFYNIPLSFSLDESLLKKKFYELSKKYHPDFFICESEDKQAEILALSILNNNAYNTLLSFDKRVEYILSINNLLLDEKFKQDPEFLMVMMELNEMLQDIEDGAKDNIDTIQKLILDIENKIHNELLTHTTLFDETKNESVLNKIKDSYFKQKYILKIKNKIIAFS